jgi:hypothetical protein
LKHAYYKEKPEAVLIASNETGLEVNAEKKLSIWVCLEIRIQD